MNLDEQSKMIDEIFTRLREDERRTSEVCVKLDMVVEQMKTSTAVTDKFLEALDKRRIADEAREAKFWKALYIIGGSLIALALGRKPVARWAAHVWPEVPQAVNIQAVIPWHDDKYTLT